jgi:hypothetical protein
VYLGETIKYRIRTRGPEVLARWSVPETGEVLGRGQPVRVGWQRSDLHCFPWS